MYSFSKVQRHSSEESPNEGFLPHIYKNSLFYKGTPSLKEIQRKEILGFS